MKKILRNKKGFTLMEIIVVLIIIAVLAAALIPSFVNFARDAGASSAIAEANIGMTASQAVLTEIIASGATIPADANQILDWGAPTGTPAASRFSGFVTGDVRVTAGPRHGFSGVERLENRITGITYNDGTWNVVIVGGQSATATRNP